jgi:HK97 family phage prohead protease
VPWHITPGHSECGSGQYAVVKDSDGSVEGCHGSREEATKHMAALYANEPEARAVDTSSWDGNAAMSACGEAACYRAICAGRKSGPADERGSWALPHHKRPGSPPNAAGVRNALSRLPQTQGLTNREAARSHLEAHMRAIQAQEGKGRSSEEEDFMGAVERRYTASVVQVRMADEQRKKIGGYAAVFNRYSDNLGGFIEQVAPSFFNKSRADGWPDVIARYNHDDNMLLGTTGAGTLNLQIDETGLLYEVDPPQSRLDILELVGRGDVRKSSFAFRTYDQGDEWAVNDLGNVVRTLISGQLVDVAPVNRPAYPDSTAGLRSAAGKALLAAQDLAAALESLARKFDADLEEVRSMATDNELRRFFIKTEAGMPAAKPKPRMFGPAAASALLARKEDPWG